MGYLVVKFGIYLAGAFVSLNFLSNFKKQGVDPHPFYKGLNNHGKVFLVACIIAFIFGIVDIYLGYTDNIEHGKEVAQLTKSDSTHSAQLSEVRSEFLDFKKEYENDSARRNKSTNTYISEPITNNYTRETIEKPLLVETPPTALLNRGMKKNPELFKNKTGKYTIRESFTSANQYVISNLKQRILLIEITQNKPKLVDASPWEKSQGFITKDHTQSGLFEFDMLEGINYYIVLESIYTNRFNNYTDSMNLVYEIDNSKVGMMLQHPPMEVYDAIIAFAKDIHN